MNEAERDFFVITCSISGGLGGTEGSPSLFEGSVMMKQSLPDICRLHSTFLHPHSGVQSSNGNLPYLLVRV